ncbi:hypothetical protein CALVIDRAFT_595589 [Calocera viscosa TUFC12733]|uniref:Urease accessory protein UreF n=1 Tax=Calocera viscosa (strain TUFC12733) TaxID=1330018 RepID=A0A167QSB8_CALVF|nr:hypothetical protein CALVIDRAFT_595589 [Calocera viscosa TUFC12733]
MAAPISTNRGLDDTEAYILLILADSNLPTGAFVASAGLESFFKHGFGGVGLGGGAGGVAVKQGADGTMVFLRSGIASYARSASAFVRDAHAIVAAYMHGEEGMGLEETLAKLGQLDALYEAMTLNHVARRASTTQGIALLTLYSKGFTKPPGSFDVPNGTEGVDMEDFVVEMKLRIRRGRLSGHLPVCWAVMTAALGLQAERSVWLHLFLHARALLSASVRLNTLGPYAAQQLLLHSVRPLVDNEMERPSTLHSGLLDEVDNLEDDDDVRPANTWPLGEILAARHDLQHSRIFNS